MREIEYKAKEERQDRELNIHNNYSSYYNVDDIILCRGNNQ